MTKSSHFIEYMKLHLISLEQDLEAYEEKWKDDIAMNVDECLYSVNYMNGLIETARHLLSVATDIMNAPSERYE